MMRVLFVCIHNAGRSQMAEAMLRHMAKARNADVIAASAGTLGGGNLNPLAAEAMREIEMPMDGQYPKALTQEMADEADVVVSMGCGVDAAACPARFLVTEDWGLDDPAGQSMEVVRKIRDQIRVKTAELLDRLEG